MQIINSDEQDSSGEKIVSMASILSHQKSEKWYIIHLNEAVVIPLAYCLVLPRFVQDRRLQPFSLISFTL